MRNSKDEMHLFVLFSTAKFFFYCNHNNNYAIKVAK